MRILMIVLLAASVSAFAGLVEFGGHAGVFIPVGDSLDGVNTSPIFGVNILAHMPTFAIEGSISYAPLSTEDVGGIVDYSMSMIPILAGVRTYAGPIFYGGGLGLYIASVSGELLGASIDDTETDFGAYGNVGMIFPTGGMDIEASLKYHLVDFEFNDAMLGLTAGINF
ncbi:MAG: hypothetical protein KAW14_14465 [Candidatus Aegiribacteria sp.]|nr:hypothetical protein [Candidatus Aegiribacteria sp.]